MYIKLLIHTVSKIKEGIKRQANQIAVSEVLLFVSFILLCITSFSSIFLVCFFGFFGVFFQHFNSSYHYFQCTLNSFANTGPLNSMWTRIWHMQMLGGERRTLNSEVMGPQLNPTVLILSNLMAAVLLKRNIVLFYLDFVLF